MKTPEELLTDKLAVMEAGLADCRRGQRQLEEAFSRFVELTADQLGKLFIIPLLQSAIRPDIDMKPIAHPELDIIRLIKEVQKHKKRKQ